MKIAQIVSTYPPYYGGMGNVVLQTVSALTARGHEVTVLTPQYDAEKPAQREISTEQKKHAQMLRPSISFGNAARLPQIKKMLNDFDVVHLHYPFFGTANLVKQWKKANPDKVLALTYHMDTRAPGLKGLLFSLYAKFYMPRILEVADVLIGSSFDYIDHSDAASIFKRRTDNAFELPFGVDVDRFAPREKPEALFVKHGLNPSVPTLVFVGGMDSAHYFKGIPVLLKALHVLKAQDFVVQAALIGDGNLRRQFEFEAQGLGLSESVRFVGSVSDRELPYYYNMGDVAVLPSISRAEAFGMVLLEAYASGLPVIASDLPGVRSVAMKAGVVVTPGSAVQLAGRIQEFFDEQNNQKKWHVIARQVAMEEYSWPIIAEKLEMLYEQAKQ